MIKVVLFDLDGTLLPMDQRLFTKTYFGLLAQRLARHGYEPQKLIEAIWTGTAAMVKNNGEKTNEEVFWNAIAEIYGAGVKEDIEKFDEFYREEFDGVRKSCGFDPKAAETVRKLKEKGLRVALATNPIFPRIATQKRIAWAGLSPDEFELYTTYETSRHCKPNPYYYIDILREMGVKAEECLMAGNDVSEDMIAKEIGMDVFLLTACLINKEEKDITAFPQGNFDDLLAYIENK